MPETVSWIAADGTETVLSGQAHTETLWGRQGAFMPPASFIEEEVPLQPGARLRAVKTGVRELDLPLLIRGSDSRVVREQVRQLLRLFDATRGDGRLRVTPDDGQARELVCRYSNGLLGDESDGAAGVNWQRVVLTFRAVDPYWHETQPLTVTFGSAASLTPFFPFFPLRLNQDTLLGVSEVTNPGDVAAWPVWTIRGPGDDLVLTNVTTGESLTLAGHLSETDVVTIDTRPGIKSVRDASNGNLFGRLSTLSVLWALAPGLNLFSIALATTTAQTSVTMVATPRYLGA